MTDDTSNQQQTQADPKPAAEDSKEGLYAAYDHTLLRFIGGTGTKAEAAKAAKAGPKGHRVTVRKV